MSPGLYLHVPFCSAICPYCDFSVLTGGEERRERFVEDVLTEIDLWSAESQERFGPFDTVYFGGGTPSILTPEQLRRLHEAIGHRLGVTPHARLFLEANPEDVTPERLDAWRELGVETLSLGVQSFQEETLELLGRRHSPNQARQSVALALEAGFPTVSLDLIYGLPGQTKDDLELDLEAAVALQPDHLSCYQLTIHEGTPFGFRRERGKLTELPEDDQGELFLHVHRFLADAGWEGYEVSNFARAPEHRSRHNAKYWDHTPYLGLGPSAHSHEGRQRWWNRRKIGPWQAAVEAREQPVEEIEDLTPEDLALEHLMLGLRTYAGVDLDRARDDYGLELETTSSAAIDRLVGDGLLVVEDRHLRPTLEGLAVADFLARSFEVTTTVERNHHS